VLAAFSVAHACCAYGLRRSRAEFRIPHRNSFELVCLAIVHTAKTHMPASLQEILSSYNDSARLAEASTIPASWYVEPRIAELERVNVFSRTWQLVGRTDQLEASGNFITGRLAGEPFVVVRGSDGVLRGFLNVCRHHAAAVVTQPCWMDR